MLTRPVIQHIEGAAESDGREPWASGRPAAGRWTGAGYALRLGIQLFLRDQKGRYRDSLLGASWSIAVSILLSLGLFYAQRIGLLTVGDWQNDYLPRAMIGFILWQLFTDAWRCGPEAVRESKPMLLRAAFPREALIVGKALGVGLQFLLRWVVALAALIPMNLALGPELALLPILSIPLAALGIGLGLLTLPLFVFFRDYGAAQARIMQAAMFLTPVFYPIPANGALLAKLMRLNPIACLIDGPRQVVLDGTVADALRWAVTAALAFAFLAAGLAVFRASISAVSEFMGD